LDTPDPHWYKEKSGSNISQRLLKLKRSVKTYQSHPGWRYQ